MCVVYNDQKLLVMNKYPLIEMLAFFCRHSQLTVPTWRKTYVRHLKRVRSCHTILQEAQRIIDRYSHVREITGSDKLLPLISNQ